MTHVYVERAARQAILTRLKIVPEGQVDDQDDDYNSDLVHWLEDSGRRPAIRLHESAEERIRYLEELTGRKLASRQDILDYFKELKEREAELQRSEAKRRVVRETFFLGVLALAAAQYYYWDISLQIAALQKVHYFVPVAAAISS